MHRFVIGLFTVVSMLSSVAPSLVFAQTSPGESTGSVNSEFGVRNCTLHQNGRALDIACDFIAGKGVQPDIKYAVQLIQTGTARTIVDEQVYPEIVTLKEGQTLNKKISYTIPGFLQGAAEVWVMASNSEGLRLGMSNVGTINATALDGNLQIAAENCFIKVEGESSGKSYSIKQGVDVLPGEMLSAYCTVTNPGRTGIQAHAEFSGFRRNIYGATVEIAKFPQPTSGFAPQEKRELKMLVPLASSPQAYDDLLVLKNDKGETISNSVAIHYVIRGASATVQNITLDKDYYPAGSKALIVTSWTGSADGHPQSRFEKGTDEQARTFKVVVKDGTDAVCGESTQTVPDSQFDKTKPLNFSVAIAHDCYNPKVSATIVDANGNTLVEKDVSVQSAVQPPAQNTATTTKQPALWSKLMLLLGGGVLVLLLLALVFWRMIKNRKTGSVTPLLFMLALGAALCGHVSFAEAASIHDVSFTGVFWVVTDFTVDINKTTYAPGEAIVASGVFHQSICSDGDHVGGRLTIKNDADGQVQELLWKETYMFGSEEGVQKSVNFTAPTTPGNYTITFTGKWKVGNQDAGPGTSVSIPYTVTASGAPNVGAVCYSTSNNCGDTTSGTVQADGSCSATTIPPNPPDNCPTNIGYQCPATACLPTANGQCGADNGLPSSVAPTRLCDVGTASAVSGIIKWTWSCAGTGGGTTASCSAPKAPALPTISPFSINGSTNPPTVPYNSSLAITWGSANVTTCSGSGNGWSTTALSGNQSVLATISSLYTLTCFNAVGAWVSSSVSVSVQPPAPVATLEASVNGGAYSTSDQTVDPTDTVRLRWSNTDNGASCAASSNPSGLGFSASGASGFDDVTTPTPGTSADYTVTCTNVTGGGSDTLKVTTRQKPNFNKPNISIGNPGNFDPVTGKYGYVDVIFATQNNGGSDTKADAPYQVDLTGLTSLTGIIPSGLTNVVAGFNKTVRFNGPITFGATTVGVSLDTTNAVPESDETDNNNTAVLTIPPPDPGLTITADRGRVRNSETTTIRWNIGTSYAGLVCQVTGPSLNLTNAPASGSRTTQPITAKSEYTYTCTETTTGTVFKKTTVVETEGKLEEV
jgi:hypothetical protein